MYVDFSLKIEIIQIYKSSVVFGVLLSPIVSSELVSWDSRALIASICLKTVEKAYGITVSIIINVIRRITAVGKISWTS